LIVKQVFLFAAMDDLGGALEYLVGIDDLIANLDAAEAADVPGAYYAQPTTPPDPQLPPSQVGRKPDEKISDDEVSEEESDSDAFQARQTDIWWQCWLKRYLEIKEEGGKGCDKGSHKDAFLACGSKATAVAIHKRSLIQCGSKAKAAATVRIMPSSSEKASPPQLPQPPWRNKQQKIDTPRRPPFPPAFPPPAFGPNPPGFAPPAYLIGPIPSGFPPGMQAPPPPPGYVEPPPPSGYYASMRKPCLVPPPPPPAAVLPSQSTGDDYWFKPSSKNKAMPKTRPPGGTRKNWEKQYRIVKEKSNIERMAFLERWPRPTCKREDDHFSEMFRTQMKPSASAEIYRCDRGVKRDYEAKHGSID
jgi:hypothetical protein